MSSEQIGVGAVHPLEALVAAVEADVAAASAGVAWTLTPAQLVDLVPRLSRVRDQLEAVALTLVREADRHQVGDPIGAANTGAWLANVTRVAKPAAHRAVALAAQLDKDEHEAARAAALAGAITVPQAAVIATAIDELPRDLVDASVKRKAEQDLIGFARDHGPRELRFLGRRILEYVAPDIADEAERRILEAEERGAAAAAYFEMHPDGHGSVLGRFKVPVLAGAMLAKHLNAIAAPKHQAARGVPKPEQRIARPIRLGAAFVEYLETRDAAPMPKAGGVPATVVVTMTLEALLGAEQAATLDDGERISASEARRLACQAGIIPVVLGGKSQPLDVGRTRRFHTEAQRMAIILRDRTCRVEGCDHPAAMSHIHHLEQWAKGGKTTVEDAITICPRHHALAHDSRYGMKRLANDRFRFILRT
ncbi:MAG TPA: DUF222 domain-containing protein [Marmoricola sp.]|jgi:hypothetical protein|nr:DUF222 domain-containing protein [Marmoricola sp.]